MLWGSGAAGPPAGATGRGDEGRAFALFALGPPARIARGAPARPASGAAAGVPKGAPRPLRQERRLSGQRFRLPAGSLHIASAAQLASLRTGCQDTQPLGDPFCSLRTRTRSLLSCKLWPLPFLSLSLHRAPTPLSPAPHPGIPVLSRGSAVHGSYLSPPPPGLGERIQGPSRGARKL